MNRRQWDTLDKSVKKVPDRYSTCNTQGRDSADWPA